MTADNEIAALNALRATAAAGNPLVTRVSAINWNAIEDETDLTVWNRVTSNFWLPEKVPLSNDVQSWATLRPHEQLTTMRVFTGLTMLDTVQATVGATSMMADALTPHEESVLGNFVFMEALAGDTDVLTPRGWKPIKTVTTDDRIAQYVPHTGALEFVHPTAVTLFDAGETYEIVSSNGMARQVVSGGHRVYYEQKTGVNTWTPRVAEARELAHDISLHDTRFRVTGTSSVPGNMGLDDDDALRLASAVLPTVAEDTETVVVDLGVGFDLRNGRTVWAGMTTVHDDGHTHLHIPRTMTVAPDMLTTQWSLDEVSPNRARAFLTLAAGLNGVVSRTGSDVLTVRAADDDVADFMVALVALSNGTPRKVVTDEGFTVVAQYTTQTVAGASILVKDAEPQLMYCVKVPSTYLLTRNGESTVVTGNCVHAKSYSSIFSTLCSTKEIDDAFRWSEENENLQRKARILLEYYRGGDALKKKITSVMLESFLFYSGFYLPLYWSSRAKLTNTADIIRLILRDESFAAGTELLTPQGWKDVKDITENDRVVQWNRDGSMEFVHPVAVTSSEKPFTVKLENFQGHVRQHVSPGHRVVLERDVQGKIPGSKIVEIEAMDVRPQDLDVRTRFINTGVLAHEGRSLDDEDRLRIAYQADGYRAGNRHLFRFVKQRKIDRLSELLGRLGIPFTTRVHGSVTQISFTSPAPLSKKLSTICDLDKVGYKWCREFIDELSEWDGHVVKENPDRITWGSTDEGNARYVQAVASLAGYRTHWGVRTDSRSESYNDIYRVHIHRALNVTGAQKVNVERVNEPSTVYSIEVPSSYLLTRNNGSVVVTGNSIHGYYIGYKFQRGLDRVDSARKDELKSYTYSLLLDLYDNEVEYAQDLYDELGWTEEVKKYMRYNANKALSNLGYDALFPTDECRVNPAILSAMDAGGNETHDFFSGSGSSYVMGKAVATDDEDWDF